MGIVKKFRIKSFKDERTQIELKDVSMSYNKREIFSNLSFKINKGEIMGMLGPNGVGKSTIFYLISGLAKPNYGKVVLNGKDVTNYPIYERATKFKIGYVPQHGGFFHDLTLIENLKSVAEIQIKNKSERILKINNLISKFELDSALDTKAKFLSGGQKKKLVIAMALINDPNILLLDECFAALDVLTIRMLQQIIVNLQTIDNITICICDHQARDLLSCVDKAIVLSNGHIIAHGTPGELVNDARAKSAYFGEEFKIN
ncbi:MAG: ATP-binding cassette domain-containing protein [Candidatus Pelagibacter bacterium]|jgi:lipopolysaccharide export system ATP-binding protein|nr:ATP-binding cassette domain-containing protein [Candidatus Pelagibacter bacterium]|tara:strand:- start:4612 stop:5388 length:777 start_codon:yes stop_codon:yes gene_type:complete